MIWWLTMLGYYLVPPAISLIFAPQIYECHGSKLLFVIVWLLFWPVMIFVLKEW